MLLGISVMSIFVARTGLIPTKISVLGIEFEKTDQNAFLVVMALIVLYFVAAFLIYGFTDFLAWRVSYNQSTRLRHEEVLNILKKKLSGTDDPPVGYFPPPRFSHLLNSLASPISFVRALFEFLLPLVVGSYAIYALISAIDYAT